MPVLELYNGRTTEETLQSVVRILTSSRRLHCRSKDVPFLRNSSAVFNKTVLASTGTVNLARIKLNANNLATADEKEE